MKKRILLLIISLIILIILVYLSILTVINIYNNTEWSITSLWISPLLTVFLLFVNRYIAIKDKRIIKYKYQFDRYFSDRQKEYENVRHFIKESEESTCYITGRLGIGKTEFLKEMADRINNKIIFFKYQAIYIDLKNNSSVMKEICKTLGVNTYSESVQIISDRLHDEKNKKWIILIDGVCQYNILFVKNFADSIYECSKIKCIIAYEDLLNRQSTVLSAFNKSEIKELAKKERINCTDEQIEIIIKLSLGVPVYIRLILNQLKINGIIDLSNNKDIKDYLGIIITQKLNITERKLLMLICCLSKILNEQSIEIKEIANINRTPRICESLKILFQNSLLEYADEKIIIATDICNICFEHLYEYIDDEFSSIYHYYENKKDKQCYATIALLRTNISLKGKLNSLKRIITDQFKQGNFLFIIQVGNLDLESIINNNIYGKEIYKIIQICYFKSLLEVGAYNKANDIVNNYDFTKYGRDGILNISSQNDFDIHYSVINLYHLTNRFEDAIMSCDLLLNKCKTKKEIIDVKYLKAHCIRHIGNNFEEAIRIFKEIINNKTNLMISPKSYIRSCYSILSIEMLKGIPKELLSFTFKELYEYANTSSEYEIIKPYIQRHEIIYIASYENRIDFAIQTAKDIINKLEILQLRIKYDYYFELAELFRHQFFKTYKEEYYCESRKYYSMAIEFSSVAGDYNLESMCILGMSLLEMISGKSVDILQLKKIASICNTKGLVLNYHCVNFLVSILEQNIISDTLVQIYKNLGFGNIYNAATLYKQNKFFYLKLVVM